MLETIRSFHRLLSDPPEAKLDRLVALAKSLDQLAMAYHQATETIPDSASQSAPKSELSYAELRKLISSRFPELGLYATIVSGPPSELEGIVGDAIDDLADIASDLEEIVWRSENAGIDDATWHFRFGYLTHWGQHLVELRAHIHYLMREELV